MIYAVALVAGVLLGAVLSAIWMFEYVQGVMAAATVEREMAAKYERSAKEFEASAEHSLASARSLQEEAQELYLEAGKLLESESHDAR